MIILTCAVAFEGDLGMFCVSRAPELILLCRSDRMAMGPRRDASDAVRNVIWLMNAPLRRLTRTNAHCRLALFSPGNANVSSRVKPRLRRGPRAAVNGASEPRSSSGNSPAALGECLCESGLRHACVFTFLRTLCQFVLGRPGCLPGYKRCCGGVLRAGLSVTTWETS